MKGPAPGVAYETSKSAMPEPVRGVVFRRRVAPSAPHHQPVYRSLQQVVSDHGSESLMQGQRRSLPSESLCSMKASVRLEDAFASFSDYWNPRVIGDLNGQQVKVAKLKGSFIWHHHDNEDELFLVVKGVLRIEMRDGDVTLAPGEMFIVPRGIDHRPVAEEEVHLLLFEPASTLNTGNVRDHRTVEDPERI